MHKYLGCMLLIATSHSTPLLGTPIHYISMHAIKPGQLRYTQVIVHTKKRKLRTTAQLYNNRTSSINNKSPLPVIKAPSNIGYILIDGHHEYLAAQSLGDTTAPIKIVYDLSHLSREDFYHTACKKNYVYPYKIDGTLVSLPTTGWFSWDSIQDDPNRLFASIVSLRCAMDKNNQPFYFKAPAATEEPKHPLWIKRVWKKEAIAFIEFKIATKMYQNNLIYTYDMGTNPNQESVIALTKKVRALLFQDRINDLELVD